jgi:hypothetical protein
MSINQVKRISRQVTQLKVVAFRSNRKAKASTGEERAKHYRRKNAAMNALLRLGCALVDETDWRSDDPVIGLRFAGGGKLHMRISGLDSDALLMLRGQFNPNRSMQEASDGFNANSHHAGSSQEE